MELYPDRGHWACIILLAYAHTFLCINDVFSTIIFRLLISLRRDISWKQELVVRVEKCILETLVHALMMFI